MTDTSALQELQAWMASTGAEKLSIQSDGAVLLEDQTGYRPHHQTLPKHMLERILPALRQPGDGAIHEGAWRDLGWILIEPPVSQRLTIHLHQHAPPVQSWRHWVERGWLRAVDAQWITQRSETGANLLITACYLSAAQRILDTLLATPRDPGVMFLLSKRHQEAVSTLTVLNPDHLPAPNGTAGNHLLTLLQNARWVWCDHLADRDAFHWWMSGSPYSKGRVGVMTARNHEDIERSLKHRAEDHGYPWPGWIDGIIHVDAAHHTIHLLDVDDQGRLQSRKRSQPGITGPSPQQVAAVSKTPPRGQDPTMGKTPPQGQNPAPAARGRSSAGSRERGVPIQRDPTPPQGVVSPPNLAASALGRIQRPAAQGRTRPTVERRSAVLHRGRRPSSSPGTPALLGHRTDSGRFSSSGMGDRPRQPSGERPPKSSASLRRIDALAPAAPLDASSDVDDLEILSPQDIELVHGPTRGDNRDKAFDAKTRDMPALSDVASAMVGDLDDDEEYSDTPATPVRVSETEPPEEH